MQWTHRILVAVAGAALVASAVLVPVGSASAETGGDLPAGFWYGTDSTAVSITGSAPYSEPDISGAYGGYIGMNGDWANWQGCARYSLPWSSTNSAQADRNYTDYGRGVGTGAYWFMGGPGVDPHYSGGTTEAFVWGQEQAARMLSNLGTKPVKYPVLFMDVEIPGSTRFDPATDNGWNDVYTSACSGRVAATGIAASVDRADFNGFAAWIGQHSSYKVGVYSSPAVWGQIFGDGRDGTLGNTYEWTYSAFTSSLSHHPDAWCLRGTSTCAQFFGGITSASSHAVMWQWSGGGGSSNGVGDFDQIDANRVH